MIQVQDTRTLLALCSDSMYPCTQQEDQLGLGVLSTIMKLISLNASFSLISLGSPYDVSLWAFVGEEKGKNQLVSKLPSNSHQFCNIKTVN